MAAIAQSKLDAVEERLGTLMVPKAAQWANEARADAIARLRKMGMPARRDEYWKYTRPDSLISNEAQEAAAVEFDEDPVFGPIDRLKIVFVDGVYDPAASDDLALEGLSIEMLEDVCALDFHWARDVFGVLESAGQTPVERPLAALNTGGALGGVVIHATGKISKPVSLIYLHKSKSSDAILHHVIKIESGAEMTLLENGPSAARVNNVLEVDIADTGVFHHLRAQGREHDRRGVAHIFARLGAQSTFKSFTLTVNGALTRNECVIEMVGDNSVAHVAGAAMGDGADGNGFHHDDTVFVTHIGQDCESRQVFKNVLRNGATGVFQGKILVKQGAQKTDGYQISQALMLDGDSQFLAKPELEIYADDVICSHGSTSGAIDEEALFYLRSRGVPIGPATDLLTLAFLAEAVVEIDNGDLAQEISDRLEGWLTRRRG